VQGGSLEKMMRTKWYNRPSIGKKGWNQVGIEEVLSLL
jgi:hypothetical protein